MRHRGRRAGCSRAVRRRRSSRSTLDTPLPRQCSTAIPLLEAIEQRAAEYGVPIDARIERGRDRRHALRETIAHETYDGVVIAASAADSDGFHSDDVAVRSRNGSRALATQSS